MLNIFTIVLDGMPFITWHLPIFEQLKCDWRWFIAEGRSGSNQDTAWCKQMPATSSTDGTLEYLAGLRKHKQVRYISKPLWFSKTEMCNAALEYFKEPGVLMQIDCDEIWKAEQLDRIVHIFEHFPKYSSIMFDCRYFVGPELITTTDNAYGHNDYEWLRAWRFQPGMTFESHEPPKLIGENGKRMGKAESREEGLIFDHFPYVLESQVAAKEAFYGYTGAVQAWRALQAHQHFPDKLQKFFHWADNRAMVDRFACK